LDNKRIIVPLDFGAAEPALAFAARLDPKLCRVKVGKELFVAEGDGKNQKQITSFGCASFAPTFTPDGKKILFASNKHKCDGRDFELYLINTDGTGLEQVTDFGGFTSFPEFSPDGKKLIFSSSYQSKSNYEFNLFTVDWKP